MVFSATCWGLFGVISSQASITETPPVLFLLISTFFSIFIAYLYALIGKLQPNTIIKKIIFDKDGEMLEIKRNILFRGFFSLGRLFIVVGFYLLSNKILGAIISELYPLIAIALSVFLLDKHFKKDPAPKYSGFLLAFVVAGLFLLYSDDLKVNPAQLNQIGLFFVGLGAVFAAFNLIYGIKLTKSMKVLALGNSNFTNSLISQGMANFILFIFLAVISILLYDLQIIQKVTFEVIILAFAFGLFVDLLSSSLGRVAGVISDNRNISAVRFLSPVISILLLWVFGFGEINPTIVFAFILILVPNILLNLNLRCSFSLKATFILVLLSLAFLFYTNGIALEPHHLF